MPAARRDPVPSGRARKSLAHANPGQARPDPCLTSEQTQALLRLVLRVLACFSSRLLALPASASAAAAQAASFVRLGRLRPHSREAGGVVMNAGPSRGSRAVDTPERAHLRALRGFRPPVHHGDLLAELPPAPLWSSRPPPSCRQ